MPAILKVGEINQIADNRGSFDPQQTLENIWALKVMTGQGQSPGTEGMEARDAAKPPKMHRTAPSKDLSGSRDPQVDLTILT